MNRKVFIYTLAASLVLGLGSCTSEDFWDTFDRTVDGPICFTTGVETSSAQRAFTRAGSVQKLENGTQVRLRAKGFWEFASPKDSIIKYTTALIKDEDKDGGLNYEKSVPFYWDDFGAGDPNNATHTAHGITVLGVAVNGLNTAPKVKTDEWNNLLWPLVDGSNGVNAIEKDIIISNNLAKKETCKFAKKATPKNLDFIHPLSKITFNIKAGEGFPADYGITKFAEGHEPVLVLSKSNEFAKVGEEANRYVLATGKIKIEDGVAESDGTMSSVVVGTTSTPNSSTVSVIKQALVYPDTQLGKVGTDIIAALKVDENVYYIKAAEIHAAMDKYDKEATEATPKHTDHKTLPGVNYIIKITVNKTGVRFTASVTDWDNVEAANVDPEIDVTTHIGVNGKGNEAPDNFISYALWRSTNIINDYQHESTLSGGAIDGNSVWTASQQLYWPDHNTHYHLRGIFPHLDDNMVEKLNDEQVVKVSNDACTESTVKNTFPCNFMIGMPEFGDADYMCKSELHASKDMREEGICARSSAINLNFRYVMSQVEVELTSNPDQTATDYVNLTNSKVYLVNVGNDGAIKLSDRSAIFTDDGKQSFLLPNTSGKNFRGIIIPQTLVNDDAQKSNKVRIKIEVYDKDDPNVLEDVYYADVAPIEKSADNLAAPNGKWEAGVHYKYTLKITKTKINATATLTDWQHVDASTEVWF